MNYRVGVDVGGTFTDFLVIDEGGNAEIYKTSTTPQDPSIGLFRGLEKAANSHHLDITAFLRKVDTIVHGTTITTNAVLTREGARTGFITTKGFRDILNMRRGLKERQFEKYSPPPPLIPRHLIRPVTERTDVDGVITQPLDEDDVLRSIEYFKEQQVEAVAVSLLWSFRNPINERRIGEILQQQLPDVYLSLSVDILPQIRVYERNSTTALNAYVGPVLKRYLDRLQQQLRLYQFTGRLLIMQSNGGVMSPEVARRHAANTLLSGPAGAPMAGVFYGGTHDFKNIITVDMGGTSFDVALVQNSTPTVTTEGLIGEHRIASPILDIHTIGAGGGSIAWITEGGLLAVGPKSAGAVPGPACYGRGGQQPTVTDAHYLLGYIDPACFDPGELSFDREAASTAIAQQIAQPLKIETVEAAYGIYQLATHKMAAALNTVSIQRGFDPREFVLVVAGGAGPIHAAAIARELDISVVLIPRESSVFCAAGMLISDLQHDQVYSYAREMDRIDLGEVNRLFTGMRNSVSKMLRSEGISQNKLAIRYSIDLRYVGQFNEVEVPLTTNTNIRPSAIDRLCHDFHKQHDLLYGYAMDNAELEIINLRVTGKGRTGNPTQHSYPFDGEDAGAARIGERRVYFDEGEQQTPVYDALKLKHGNQLTGPAVLVQPTTTILLPPDYSLMCDPFHNYLIYPRNKDIHDLCCTLSQKE